MTPDLARDTDTDHGRGALALADQLRLRDTGRRPCELVTDDQDFAGAGFDRWDSSPRGLTLAPGALLTLVREHGKEG